MAAFKDLNGSEKKRLKKIEKAFNWRWQIGVKEVFNAAGKLEQFGLAPTEEEKSTQKALLRKAFNANSDAESAYYGCQDYELFTRVALRVGTESEVASPIQGNGYTEEDVKLLEKCDCPSLAAILRIKIKG